LKQKPAAVLQYKMTVKLLRTS